MPASDRRTQAEEIIARLKREYPEAKIALKYGNPWELLVATILSAQATDKKVNEVTAALFKKYRTVEDYAYADPTVFEQDIKQTGFFRNKTKSVIGSAQAVLERFGGRVPATMGQILTLPGVARKTANVVLGNAYGVVEGIAVDTHVFRLSHRLGLSGAKTPQKTEPDLMEIVPKKDWFLFTYLIIDHGRAVCTAKAPACDRCVLNDICPSAFQFPNFK